MRLLRLAPNSVPSFYPGAGRVAAFRRDDTIPAQHPEDWIAATVSRTGLAPSGMTRLEDGTFLAEELRRHPHEWFGDAHLARHGPVPGLLVKLLDAGVRLPLHIHPDQDFAQQHLGSRHGKTEAWVVLVADLDAAIHVGFAREVTPDDLYTWVRTEDTEALLAASHRVPVVAGDVLACPAGVPHAIGAGILVLEVQEPTDLSIMLEHRDVPLDPSAHFLGLEPHEALSATDRSAVSPDVLDSWRGPSLWTLAGYRSGAQELMPAAVLPFFGAQQLLARTGTPVALPQGFSVLIALEGTGHVVDDRGDATTIHAGETFLFPHAAGVGELTGDISVVRCTPPLANT